MEGENIICFAKDWGDGPTSNDHVMRMLAKRNKVLWLNSIAMRKPNLGSRNDLSKIGRKLKSFTKGPVHVDERLWVYTPIVLPLPHSSVWPLGSVRDSSLFWFMGVKTCFPNCLFTGCGGRRWGPLSLASAE